MGACYGTDAKAQDELNEFTHHANDLGECPEEKPQQQSEHSLPSIETTAAESQQQKQPQQSDPAQPSTEPTAESTECQGSEQAQPAIETSASESGECELSQAQPSIETSASGLSDCEHSLQAQPSMEKSASELTECSVHQEQARSLVETEDWVLLPSVGTWRTYAPPQSWTPLARPASAALPVVVKNVSASEVVEGPGGATGHAAKLAEAADDLELSEHQELVDVFVPEAIKPVHPAELLKSEVAGLEKPWAMLPSVATWASGASYHPALARGAVDLEKVENLGSKCEA